MPNLYLRQADGTPVATFKMYNDFTARTEQEEVTVYGIVPEVVSADYADGGVTAAAIETEADFYSGAGSTFPSPSKGLRYQRERDEARTMAKLWKETARRAIQRQSILDRIASTSEKVADRAREERDEAVNVRNLWAKRSDQWERAEQRAVDERNAALSKLADHEDCPRPLTPEDITDETAAKVAKALGDLGHGWVPPHYMHKALACALAPEPPQRPEGAEELETVCAGIKWGGVPVNAGDLADYLAKRGVRVVTEDDDHTPACEGIGDGLPCPTCASYWAGDREDGGETR